MKELLGKQSHYIGKPSEVERHVWFYQPLVELVLVGALQRMLFVARKVWEEGKE
jgi:hypothetical protein